MPDAIPDVEKEEVFVFLDELQESGITNMFGGAAYIQEAYPYTSQQCLELLKEWMNTYEERHP